jgi:transposase
LSRAVDASIRGAVYLAWATQHLALILRPVDIIVIDSLSSHKIAGVREVVAAAAAGVPYLSPSSRDLNPIELAFSKLKKLVRDGAEWTVEKLWSLCGRMLAAFTERECRSYFQHCGYRYSEPEAALGIQTLPRPGPATSSVQIPAGGVARLPG